MLRALYPIFLGGGMAIAPLQHANAQLLGQVTLTPAEMRSTAIGAIRAGNSGRALALSEALLLRDPLDAAALEIGARAALNIEQPEAALRHARTLYQNAANNTLKFTAARIAALANTQSGKLTRAQVWLRRARQFAPTPEDARDVANDFLAVRQRNPFAFTLEFGVSPTSNINNGTSEDTFDISLLGEDITLPFSATAQNLSGYEVTAAGSVNYRLSESRSHRTIATFGLHSSTHFLTSSSRDDAPDFDASDLNTVTANTGLQYAWGAGENNAPTSASVNYGVTFFGGDVFATSAQFGLGRSWSLGETSILQGNVSVGRTEFRDFDDHTSVWSTGLNWRNRLPNSDTLLLTSRIGQSQSDAALYDYDFAELGITYDFGQIGTQFDFAVSAEIDIRSYSNNSREDETAEIRFAVGVPEMELYGFTPVVSLFGRKTNSTTERFQSEEIAIDMDFRSSF